MSFNSKIYDISGKMMFRTTGSLPPASASLNFRRSTQRKLYNRLLLGDALRTEVGQPAATNNLTAQPPAWTQHYATRGQSYGFAIPAFSSSNHESQVLNAWRSGTFSVEPAAAVPASSSLYYSKQSRFVRLLYKVTASSDLVSFGTNNQGGLTVFVANSGVFICPDAPGTGPNNVGTDYTPFQVPITVAEYGTIRDIKVWVELIHSRSTDFGPLSPTASGALATLGLSLSSPNVKGFGYGHPMWNDQRLASLIKKTAYKVGLSPTFYSDSFILWEGAQAAAPYIHTSTVLPEYKSWDTDRHMRTIFTDASHNYQPAHFDPLYATGPATSIGDASLLSASSPNFLGGSGSPSAGGNNFPWFADDAVSGSNIPSPTGSVPKGWLNGNAGAAQVGEFNTHGKTLGVNDIRPLYPLMDDIYAVRMFNHPSSSIPFSTTTPLAGFRPGLRGTEVNGTWLLQVMVAPPPPGTPKQTAVWFRQVWLEIIVDQNKGIKHPYNSRLFKFKKTSAGARPGLRFVHALSGAFNINPGLDFVYSVVRQEYGRSVGITDDTGSLNDFAVITRITGALADSLTGSDKADYRYKFLHNEFGTPFLSIISGSGLPVQLQFFDGIVDNRAAVHGVLNPIPLILQANDMQSAISRLQTTKTTAQLAFEAISASLAPAPVVASLVLGGTSGGGFDDAVIVTGSFG